MDTSRFIHFKAFISSDSTTAPKSVRKIFHNKLPAASHTIFHHKQFQVVSHQTYTTNSFKWFQTKSRGLKQIWQCKHPNSRYLIPSTVSKHIIQERNITFYSASTLRLCHNTRKHLARLLWRCFTTGNFVHFERLEDRSQWLSMTILNCWKHSSCPQTG